jgi:hypothetical protein
MKIEKLVDRLRVFSKNVKGFLKSVKTYIRTRKITRWNALTLVALFISFLASFPTLSKFYIYYTYVPPMDITLGSFNTTILWSQIYGEYGMIAGIAIINKDMDKDMSVRMEIKVNETVHLTSDFQDSFETVPSKSGFKFTLTTNLYLSANGGGGPRFPFDALDVPLKISITVYPTMKMNEFGLPAFFGDIDLQSFTKEFVIVP